MGSNDRRCLLQWRKIASLQYFILIYRTLRFDRHSQFLSILSFPSPYSYLNEKGSSLIRGPADVVQTIFNILGNDGRYPCSSSHSLAFSIGGKLFPVDPRDLAVQAFPNSVDACYPNIVATDPPFVGGYQFSWSMGTPFLKGLVSFSGMFELAETVLRF